MSQIIKILSDSTDGTNKRVIWNKSLIDFKSQEVQKWIEKCEFQDINIYSGRSEAEWEYCKASTVALNNGVIIQSITDSKVIGHGGDYSGYTRYAHYSTFNFDAVLNAGNNPKIECSSDGTIVNENKSFIAMKVTYKNPVLKDITFTRVDEGYSMKVTADNLKIYTVNIYSRDEYGVESLRYSFGAVNTECTIISSKLTEGIDRNRIEVILKNEDATYTTSKVLSYLVPSISSLTVENERNLIDDTTTLSWTSKNQSKAEIYNNNVLIKTIQGTIQLAVLNKGSLQVGKNNIEVRVISAELDGIYNGSSTVVASKSITLSRIEPTVKNFKINDTNTDNVITATWESTNQSRFTIMQGTKNIASGLAINSIEIAPGIVDIGNTGLKIIIYYDSGFDTVKSELNIEATFARNTPIIYNLEPSNLNINIDEIVSVTFATNEFCDRWELLAAGLLTKGTAERSVNFGKEVFKQGNNEMTLKIYYSPAHNRTEVRTAVKKIGFNGYGTPTPPVLDGNTTYSTATPLLTWDAIGQVEIHLIVADMQAENVIDEQKIMTNENSIILTELEDNKEYEISLSVKNKYGLWSEYVSKVIQTRFNDIILPTFDLFEAETSVFITIGGIQDPNFKSLSIYRKNEREDEWVEIADNCNIEDTIRDYTCPANLKIAYRLRVYDKNNAYKDTEIKTISINLSSYILTNLENAEDVYTIFGTPSYKFNGDFVSKLYAGQRAPRTFKGKVQYKTGTFRTTLKNAEAYNLIDFIENSNQYNLFCLRDQRGEKLYVIVKLESQDPKGLKRLSVSFSFTEVNFIESKMYTGSGYKKISYLNGEYYLDGSVDLSGYDLSVTLE